MFEMKKHRVMIEILIWDYQLTRLRECSLEMPRNTLDKNRSSMELPLHTPPILQWVAGFDGIAYPTKKADKAPDRSSDFFFHPLIFKGQ